jgi:hypothetical protein
MIRNDQLQAAIIARLKANATIVALVVSGSFQDETWGADIREDQYQGTSFGYPNIRVKLLPVASLGADKDCAIVRFSVSILVFSEDGSSMEADRIAGIINNELHGKQFVSNSIAISLRLASLIPALRTDTRTWRSEALMNGIASG